jgi:hypothetical protein
MPTKIGRMKPGKYWKGPEPFGCFNTGHAPIIWRPMKLDKFFIVGDEILTLYATEAYLKAKQAILNHCLSFGFRGQLAWVFWTKKATERQFNKLIDQRLAELKKDRDHVKDLAAKASKGDISAVLELGDYGVL